MANDSLFSGLRVLDIASYIAGPAAATVLSDFGADVIKVERPGTRDPYRYTYLSPPNPCWKDNYLWQVTNRTLWELPNPRQSLLWREFLGGYRHYGCEPLWMRTSTSL
jgi:hypothetical protein